MQQAIEFIIGLSFSIIGLSYLVRTGEWIASIEYLKNKGKIGALTFGFGNIFLGTFIVSFHWVWNGLPLLTTIIGVICTLRGIICLLFPQFLGKIIRLIEPCYKTTLRIAGVVTLIIGLTVLSGWTLYSGAENIKEFENIFNIGNGI